MKNNLQSIVDIVNQRYKMITYNQHILGLYIFIAGYFFGKDESDLDDFELYFKNNFDSFVIKSYKCDINQNWANIIFFYEGDDEKSIRKFLDIYKEFVINFNNNL